MEDILMMWHKEPSQGRTTGITILRGKEEENQLKTIKGHSPLSREESPGIHNRLKEKGDFGTTGRGTDVIIN